MFEPTFLYIKRHNLTGKLYFGKTTSDPEMYLGSGKVWKRHIEKHGIEHVETLWYCLFLDQESCVEFALNFSKQNNIIESEDWLNLKFENGLDGGDWRKFASINVIEEANKKMSVVKKGVLSPFKGKLERYSTETLLKMSESASIRVRSKKKSLRYVVTLPSNEEILISNVEDFCSSNGISQGSLFTSLRNGSVISRGNAKGYSMRRVENVI